MTTAAKVITVVAAVHFVIGPMLTLLVFGYRKPVHLLDLDMTVIILLQLSALSYGNWVTYVAHPSFLVYS